MTRKNSTKLNPRLLILLLAIALVGCGTKPEAVPAEEKKGPDVIAVETVVARIAPMETTVSAQGTLAPGQGASARVASPIAGRLVSVRVREGERVLRGQVIAVVDNRPQQAQARSALQAVNAAQVQALEANTAAQATQTDQTNSTRSARLAVVSARADRDSAVQTAQSNLAAARTDLVKTQAGARPQEIAQADLAVTQNTATRDRAATELERVRFLYDRGIDARRQVDDAQTALSVANSTLQSAQQAANLVRAGARLEDLDAARIRVRQAQEAVSQARISGNAKIRLAEAALKQAQGAVLQVAVKWQDAQALRDLAAQKRADYTAAQATANYAEIKAPLSGVVSKRNQNPGDQADATAPILEITDPLRLDLNASLVAEDGVGIRKGMTAHISTQDNPDRKFNAFVTSVGQVDPQTNLLSVRLSVANTQGVLRAGSFAVAAIVLRRDPNALVVPRQAIISQEGKSVVYTVDSDNVAHQKEITPGSEQNGLIAIHGAVKNGERVIKLGQYELTDGAKVEEGEKGNTNAKSDAVNVTSVAQRRGGEK